MAEQGNQQSVRKLTCLCAPTTHAGSFRCRFHRASDNHWLVPQQGPSLQQASFASKSAAKAFCEYHGSEKPARDFVKSFIPPRPPLVCKPVCAAIPRPSSLSNTVSSIGGVKKPCGKAATSTFGSKIGFESSHERYSKLSQPSTPTREPGVFTIGKCQGLLSNMQSESPQPIFSL
ncbi:hypothetical protein O6H91_07G122300 [Diphasiastrum complanatum]|uniref:Uncharacterized protein n=1 Tax=Diphasiastrum complanatum TaxID=34168 RepID=A0ACC2D9R2_DIPCM|nr:hypothetical protein O6H91_07G122300 [Diphasiastrum complanatum]